MKLTKRQRPLLPIATSDPARAKAVKSRCGRSSRGDFQHGRTTAFRIRNAGGNNEIAAQSCLSETEVWASPLGSNPLVPVKVRFQEQI
jgi:hypothetical protein